MAFIEDPTLDQSIAHDRDCARKIFDAISHVHRLCHTIPGPVDGSCARGLLWSEYGAGQRFESLEDLQSYIHKRLAGARSADFADSRLHLCHMDLAPRNIIIDRRGVICLLDWANAGFYPACFETWSLLFEAHIRPHPITVELASLAMGAVTRVENDQICVLNKVFSTNQRYSFVDPDRQAQTDMIMQAVLGHTS